MSKETILLILEFAITYGPDVVSKMISAINKDQITEEDIKNLQQTFKKPEEYFKQ
jgi:hypothetical protein